MGNKLHTIIHTINGVVVDTYTSWHEDLIVKKIPNDTIYNDDIKDLLYYGSVKRHHGDEKHCFYYAVFDTI